MVLSRVRRRVRFGIRTILIVVALGCIFLGVRANDIRKHKQAVQTIKSLGGSVWVEHERPDWLPSVISTEFAWYIGVARPRTIVSYLEGVKDPELHVSHLKNLCGLWEIQVGESWQGTKALLGTDPLAEAAFEAFESQFPGVEVVP